MGLIKFLDREMLLKTIYTILFSTVKIFGAFIPFSIGVIEKEEDNKKRVFLYLVSLVVVAITFSPLVALKFLSSIILVMIIGRILETFNIENKNAWYIGFFSSVFFNDIIWNAFDNILAYDYIVAGIKGFSVILAHILVSNLKPSLKELSEKEMLTFVTFLGIMLMGIGELRLFTLNIRNIISIIAILTLAVSGGVKYSALAGLILGTLAELAKPNMGMAIISFALGGMVSGLLSYKGKNFTIWGFVLGNSILAYYITGYNALIAHFLEIAVSASIFYVMTREEIFRFKIFEPAPSNLLYRGVEQNTSFIKDLETSSGTFYSISELIDDIEVDDERYDLFDEIKEDVCFKCEKYDECWDKNYDDTMDRIFDAIEFLEEDNNNQEELLEDFCDEGKRILGKIRLRYGEYKGNKEHNGVSDIKNCVAEQFKGFSQYITQIKQKFSDEANLSLEKRIVNSFQKENYELEKVDISMNENSCEVALKVQGELPKVSFLLAANGILSRLLGKRMLASDEKQELVVFKEYSTLRVDSYVVTKKPNDVELIGDSYKIINSENNKYIMLLSDGMGVGAEANKLSNTIVELFSQMSKLGLNPGVVTNMLGSFIQYISNTEKIVTLDTLSVDLLTGECDILKIGGAPTFIVRKKDVEIIYCDTLPLGILDKIDFLEEKRILEPGDIIVSVSDGVVDSKRDLINKEYWISSFLKRMEIDEPKIIAEELLAKTIENYNNEVKDDITIIVSKICE